MKKSILSFLMSLIIISGFSQKDFSAKINQLLKHAETDFKAITGSKTSQEDKYNIFQSSLKLGVGSEIIGKNTETGEAAYILEVDYKNAVELETSLTNFCNKHAKDYDIFSDGDDDGYYITEIYKKGTSLLMMTFSVEPDNKRNTDVFQLVIFGKTIFIKEK
ncbi:hypothetical protein [Polluticaenibacter yanchengensis]|uniref:DUF4252 domain-containing protein n=1 Tax=Polluticaenibacter yanchengensis TaxID=3014562 RepID=A0ABT4UH03_9BACT|nr:hypothetical protein [Chitinophagaceae bacterium LY-5]